MRDRLESLSCILYLSTSSSADRWNCGGTNTRSQTEHSWNSLMPCLSSDLWMNRLSELRQRRHWVLGMWLHVTGTTLNRHSDLGRSASPVRNGGVYP